MKRNTSRKLSIVGRSVPLNPETKLAQMEALWEGAHLLLRYAIGIDGEGPMITNLAAGPEDQGVRDHIEEARTYVGTAFALLGVLDSMVRS